MLRYPLFKAQQRCLSVISRMHITWASYSTVLYTVHHSTLHVAECKSFLSNHLSLYKCLVISPCILQSQVILALFYGTKNVILQHPLGKVLNPGHSDNRNCSGFDSREITRFDRGLGSTSRVSLSLGTRLVKFIL